MRLVALALAFVGCTSEPSATGAGAPGARTFTVTWTIGGMPASAASCEATPTLAVAVSSEISSQPDSPHCYFEQLARCADGELVLDLTNATACKYVEITWDHDYLPVFAELDATGAAALDVP
jgi:hypothetical protein